MSTSITLESPQSVIGFLVLSVFGVVGRLRGLRGSGGVRGSWSPAGIGRVKQNRVPPVKVVSSQIRPPKYSMIFRVMARPMPVPG